MPQDESEKVVGEYKDRYVAFLDLLGFKAQVDCAEHSPAERVKLHDILLLVRDTIGGNPYLGLRFNYFSTAWWYRPTEQLLAFGRYSSHSDDPGHRVMDLICQRLTNIRKHS